MSNRTYQFGIDLGTTNSAIAVIEDGLPRLFKNSERQTDTTPSCVKVDATGAVYAGHKAYESSWDENNVKAKFKRLMGSSQRLFIRNSKREWSPEELSAEVLKVLKADAEKAQGRTISSAVITIPAAFATTQCNATIEAARLAGIEDAVLLQEPIAAAIAYGYESRHETNGFWLVYDFGGGTFDAAVIQANNGQLSVIEHSGDNFLGGADFDVLIVDSFILPALGKVFSLPESKSDAYQKLRAKLKLDAEQAKIELSNRQSALIEVGIVRPLGTDLNGDTIELSLELTRKDFDALIAPAATKALDLCQSALDRARLSAKDLSKVILVGGTTYTPFIREGLKSAYGDIIDTSVDPMTVVAKGAAIYAATLELPEAQIQRNDRAVQLKIAHPQMTNDIEEFVVIKPLEPASKGLALQIERTDGGFKSGRLEVGTDGMATIPVMLLERKINRFKVLVYDVKGNVIPSEPADFSIHHGIAISNPPLAASIGVEVKDSASDRFGKFDPILVRGTAIPAKGKKVYYAANIVGKGSEDEAVRIILYEGDNENPDRDRWIGRIKIDGKKIQRDLPANAEIEVTVSVDESRVVQASAYIPFLDQTIGKVLDKLSNREFTLNEIEDRVDESKQRIEQILVNPVSVEDERIQLEIRKLESDESLEEIEQLIINASAGDPDAKEKVAFRIQDLQARLDQIESAQQLPKLRRDLADFVTDVEEVASKFGTDREKQDAERLRRSAERLLMKDRAKRAEIEALMDALRNLYFAIITRLDEFWQGRFDWYVEAASRREIAFTDAAAASKLIQEGKDARQAGRSSELRGIVQQLYELMSSTDQAKETASRSGIKLNKR